MKLKDNSDNAQKYGKQRDWFWHGWRIRYSFYPANMSGKNQIPILLLHGFGASLKHWRYNIPVLRQNHSVYAIDLLGFGNSEKAYAEYGIPFWSELVKDFWDNFINQPCIIIGNSIGSLIALNAVANYPKIARGLVMISLPDIYGRREVIPPFLYPILQKIENLVAFPLLIRLIFYLVRQRGIITRSLKLAYVDHKNVNDELIDIIMIPPQDKGAARALIALTRYVNDFNVSAKTLLSQVHIPILLLWGKCDRLIPPIMAEKLAQINPQITLKLLDNLGHCLHDENPDLFHQLFFEWEKLIINLSSV
ncbi:alpha/beta fold hydrolase [Cyanobacterium aponinum UTEX 3222]|uniref:alpha/beta fold hydrolase n=1 Tax=Cyanobacterium aponinum TaxID=379064 RepID=UPI00308D0682|nr:alpha/beta fold hydrolase [Cyanobacterium aponinum UTEX 3222]